MNEIPGQGPDRGSTPERRRKERILKPNEFFTMFPQGGTKRTTRTITETSIMYESTATLVLPDRRLQVVSFANSLVYGEDPSINPFNPEKGYQITAEDLDDMDVAQYKLARWQARQDRPTPDPLNVSIGFMIPPEEAEAINGDLRIQISANDLLMEGRAAREVDVDDAGERRILYHTFYPLDTGPLQHLPDNGLVMQVPNDMDTLRSLQARFVVRPHGTRR